MKQATNTDLIYFSSKSICEICSCPYFDKDGCQNYNASRQATIENCSLAAQNNTILRRNEQLIYSENHPSLEELRAYVGSIEAVKGEFALIVQPGEATPKLVNWANKRKG